MRHKQLHLKRKDDNITTRTTRTTNAKPHTRSMSTYTVALESIRPVPCEPTVSKSDARLADEVTILPRSESTDQSSDAPGNICGDVSPDAGRCFPPRLAELEKLGPNPGAQSVNDLKVISNRGASKTRLKSFFERHELFVASTFLCQESLGVDLGAKRQFDLRLIKMNTIKQTNHKHK